VKLKNPAAAALTLLLESSSSVVAANSILVVLRTSLLVSLIISTTLAIIRTVSKLSSVPIKYSKNASSVGTNTVTKGWLENIGNKPVFRSETHIIK